MLKRTPLYDTHLACGAKTVDFGGFDMPVHYGSQLDEHHAVRRAAGMFDVSHMRVVDLDGPGARDFLRHLLANDVDKLVPGKALYSCMLRDNGGVIDDLIVYRGTGDAWRMVVNAGTADKDIGWMREVAAQRPAGAPALSITPHPELAIVAVQGPEARARLAQVWPAAADAIATLKPFTAAVVGTRFVGRTGYTGEDGCEVVLPAAEAPGFWMALRAAGVAPCGLGARDTLRLEAGMNLYGQDMDETVGPLESGLAWTVDLKQVRPFIGRAALEAQLAAGDLRQMVGLKLLDKGVLRAHQKVSTPLGAGEITSGTYSPTLACSVALARVPAAVAVGDVVQVDLRGKPVQAQVVKYPFVRNGKALI